MQSGVVDIVEQTTEHNDILWDRIQVEEAELFTSSQARVQYLARAVRHHGPVLNIGIGGGYLEQQLVAWGTPFCTIDPSARSVAVLQQKLGLGDEIRVGRAEQLPFADNSFGAVVVAEVLEHLTTPILEQSLAEIRRVLRVGGFITGTVPAREQLVDATVDCPRCQCQFHRWGHYQSFDRERMRSVLAEHFAAPWVVERPFISWNTLNWKGRTLAAMKVALHRLGSHGSHEKVVFRASKGSLPPATLMASPARSSTGKRS